VLYDAVDFAEAAPHTDVFPHDDSFQRYSFPPT
jgi:hypothetical protein